MAALPTPALAESMMKYFKAPDSKLEIYKDHLAILVGVFVYKHYKSFVQYNYVIVLLKI